MAWILLKHPRMTIHDALDGLSSLAKSNSQLPSLATLQRSNYDTASVVEALAQHARRRPEHPALITPAGALSYGALWTRAAAVASFMLDRGILRGDRVLISTQRPSSFAVGYFAAHLAGAISTPVSGDVSAAALSELVRRVEPKLIIGGAELGRVRAVALSFEDLDELPAPTHRIALPEGADLADLAFTRGTSARPNGVLSTHAALVHCAELANRVLGNHAGDVEVTAVSLAHPFGLARLRCSVLAGGTLIPTMASDQPQQVFDALAHQRATGLSGTPASFGALLRFGASGLGGRALNAFAGQLRYVEIAGDPMRLEHKLRLIELLPDTGLWMHYGATEAPRSAFIEFHRHKERLHTIGRPARGVEVRILSPDGSALPSGEPGVLWVKGASTASGFFRDGALTARHFAGGFVCTGDIAKLDGEGFLHLLGRRDGNLQRRALRARESALHETSGRSQKH